MKPTKTPDCNDVLKRPEGVSEDECCDLPIMRCTDGVASFWKPDPDELRRLVSGKPVALVVFSHTHPPLALAVCGDVEEKKPDPAESSTRCPTCLGINCHTNDCTETIEVADPVAVIGPRGQVAVNVEAKLATTEELLACERSNLRNLLHYVEGGDGHVPISSHAIPIRDALIAGHHWKAEAESWRKIAERKQAKTGL